jgi:two-component system response regulator HydG
MATARRAGRPRLTRPRGDAFERGATVPALDELGQNRTEAARRLGVSRATLHEKLTKHGIAGDGT